MMIYYNQREFKDEEFDEGKIIEHKSVLNAVFTVLSTPSWSESWAVLNELVDEIGLLQISEPDPIDFTSIAHGKTFPTKYNKWPTKKDPEVYKFNSFWFELR